MIPKSVKNKLEKDPRMETCEYCGSQPVQWHHVFLYAGKQMQEPWSIAAACKRCHDKATPHKHGHKPELREFFEWKALQRMGTEDMLKYPKKDWLVLANYLAHKQQEYGWPVSNKRSYTKQEEQ
jgi:hypothetical protein